MYHVTGELTWFKSVAQLVATFVRLHPRVPQQVRSRGCHQRALLTTQSLEGWGGGWRVGEAQMYPSPSVSSFCPLSQLSIQRTLAALITCIKSSAPTPPPPVFSLASAPHSPDPFADWLRQLLGFPALLCDGSHPSAPITPLVS